MKQELKKRIITSIFLIIIFFLMYFYTYILIISLIIISLFSWMEFNELISKIFSQENKRNKFYKFLYKSFSLLYLMLFLFAIFKIITNFPETEIFIFYSILISITTDIGGFTIGNIFKGKKLTKISPGKTISGSIGSFIFSLLLTPFFLFQNNNFSLYILIFIIFIISLVSQLGDLFISYLKRLAKVKNTGKLLPGHGGLLDRIDGILFALPVGLLLFNILII